MGKIITIAGPNGSGKTLYVEQMRRQMASDSVRYMAFCDSYGQRTDRAYYLQQRWNQHDIDPETPTVAQAIDRTCLLLGHHTDSQDDYRHGLIAMMGLEESLDKYVIQLSSGELRKLQLVKTLLAHPTTLIIDNPFIGLDGPTRQQLRHLLARLAEEQDITIYFVVARESEVMGEKQALPRPLPAGRGVIITGPCFSDAESDYSPLSPLSEGSGEAGLREGLPEACLPVVELRHVSIRYGERTILNDIDWTIREGEHWALCGRNGSGKSTLLSLICADNPQAYACDISLFGRQRGTGETIWDIKRRIGYVSPEMHRSYQRNLPAMQVVASGLKDTVGLYVRPNDAERELCRRAMLRFGVGDMAERPFLTLSSGEQRLVMLARAFVKEPPLLILDEPLHGLDDKNSEMVKGIIEEYCANQRNTIIMVSHYEEELPKCIDRRMTLG